MYLSVYKKKIRHCFKVIFYMEAHTRGGVSIAVAFVQRIFRDKQKSQ